MLTFDALTDFLQVYPGSGVVELCDDRVTTPFLLPNSQEPLSVWVKSFGEGLTLVHDRAAVSRQATSLEALKELNATLREEGWDFGVEIDEEGRLFRIAADAEHLNEAIAKVVQAALVMLSRLTDAKTKETL